MFSKIFQFFESPDLNIELYQRYLKIIFRFLSFVFNSAISIISFLFNWRNITLFLIIVNQFLLLALTIVTVDIIETIIIDAMLGIHKKAVSKSLKHIYL